MNHLIARLEQLARTRGEAVAIDDGRRTCSWSALERETRSLAHRLSVFRGAFALLLDNGAPWMIADLSALSAGRPLLPLPSFFSDGQLQHALDDAGATQLLTDDPARVEALLQPRGVEQLEVGGRRLHLFTLAGQPGRLPAEVAKITYTSGTTGTPKGVQLSAARMEATASALADCAGAHPGDRALALLPLAVLLENIASLYAPLLAGATLLLPSLEELGWKGSAALDPNELASRLGTLQPTTAVLTPELLKLFVQLAEQGGLPRSLRFLAVGGAVVSPLLLERASAAGLPVWQGYGLSEAASVVTLNRPGRNRLGSVGQPLPGYRLRIAEDGEVLIRGTGFLGYLGEAPPASPWLASGDLGHIDEQGYLHLAGRKRQVIINAFGRNISPEWVEAELLAEPAISQAALYGENRPWLSSILVPARDSAPHDLEQAVLRVNNRLPDYARVKGFVIARPFRRHAGEVTANGRPRHAVIHDRYRNELESLYA